MIGFLKKILTPEPESEFCKKQKADEKLILEVEQKILKEREIVKEYFKFECVQSQSGEMRVNLHEKSINNKFESSDWSFTLEKFLQIDPHQFVNFNAPLLEKRLEKLREEEEDRLNFESIYNNTDFDDN